ncbi:MAG TPA: hypothetical protein VNB94_01250 [Mycobacteriales bacterium]|nr:hypothetical protein [Mycobacteriales bacterium]
MRDVLVARSTSAATASPGSRRSSTVVPGRSSWPVIVRLAWAEARWLLRHPLTLAGLCFVGFALFVNSNASGGSAFTDLTGGGAPGLWLPPVVFFAANLGATRSRRDGVDELHGAAPVARAARTAALCGAGLPLATAALGLVVAVSTYRGLVGQPRSIVPTPAELLLLPLSVLGAVTLGVMVARWLPWRAAPVGVFIALVAVSIALSDGASSWWGSYVELVEWKDHELTDIRMAGSAAWHAAYLLGLSTMAVIGALLRDLSHRRSLWCLGAVVTLLTAGAGWAQLP